MGMIIWHVIDEEDAAAPTCGALDLATCIYNGDVSTIDASLSVGGNAVAYNTDGSEMWGAASDLVTMRGFDLATPFILPGGTMTQNSNNLVVPATARGMKWSEDGLKVFMAGTAEVYALTTPFDLSTAVLDSVNTGMNGTCGTISEDGLTAYISVSGSSIRRWDLSVAWDLTTAVDASNVLDLVNGNHFGLAVSCDQTRIYTITTATTPRTVDEYVMGTAGDLTTVPLDGSSKGVPNYSLDVSGAGVTGPGSLYVSYDQTHLLIGGATTSGGGSAKAFSFTGTAV